MSKVNQVKNVTAINADISYRVKCICSMENPKTHKQVWKQLSYMSINCTYHWIPDSEYLHIPDKYVFRPWSDTYKTRRNDVLIYHVKGNSKV